jgi:NAD(P)-dependent dehydrogenase (short-subunit alcohol dehydrogenase family)
MADPGDNTAPGKGGGRLEGRIALITGASRGIGRAVAMRFAAEGAHLILTARTQGALEEVDDELRALGHGATLVPADLADYATIDQMGAAVFERFKRLDILVGNAGVLGTLSPLAHTDPATWDRVMAVNVTANWRLIRSFDPLLRASDAGRGIFVTSGVTASPRAYWGAYAVSKTALEMMVGIYAAETAKTRVRVNLVNPGATRTRMRSQAFPGEDPSNLKSPEDVTDLFVDLAEPTCIRNGEVLHCG